MNASVDRTIAALAARLAAGRRLAARAARRAPRGAAPRPGRRLEPVPARPAGHAGRPARDRPPDLRAGDHARGDLRRRRVDRPQAAPYLAGVTARATRRGGRGRRRRARHARRAVPGAAGRRSTSSTRRPLAAASRDGARRRAGHRASGRRVARASSSPPARRRLGRDAAAVHARRPSPGDYQLTPPAFAPAGVHPLVARQAVRRCARASQFRPPAAAGADERASTPRRSTRSRRSAPRPARRGRPTRRRSASSGTRRSGRPGTGSPRRPRSAHHARPRRGRARRSRALNLTFADSVIAFYDAKYAYRLWRPVTAIRADATTTRTTPTLDAALAHRAGPVLSGRPRHDQRRRRPTCSPRVYGNDFAFR